MKKTPRRNSRLAKPDQDLRPEYRLDYTKAKPNRFARSASRVGVVVVLDEDVAEVFRDTKSVNQALRAILAAVPARRKSSAKGG